MLNSRIHDLHRELAKVREERAKLSHEQKYCGHCNEGMKTTRLKIFDGPSFEPGFEEIAAFFAKGLPYQCECIGGEKWIDAEHQIHTEIMMLSRKKQRIADIVGTEYVNCSTENYQWDRVVDGGRCRATVEDWMREPNRPFFIQGKSGIGKTHIVTGLLAFFELTGKIYRYVKGNKIDDIAMMEDGRVDRVEDLVNVPYLVIDDISKSVMTEPRNKIWYTICDERRNNGRTTVYTADVPMDKLWSSYQDATKIAPLITRISHNATMLTLKPWK
jgi:DNA replication protein DnaC